MASVDTTQTITGSVAEWPTLLARYTGLPTVTGRTITINVTARTVTIVWVGKDPMTPGG